MHLPNSKRRDIIHFLEDLTHRMKNQMLTQQEERMITECYLRHAHHDHHSQQPTPNDETIKKYLVMGWYVYQTFQTPEEE